MMDDEIITKAPKGYCMMHSHLGWDKNLARHQLGGLRSPRNAKYFGWESLSSRILQENYDQRC
jgi:V8-like Glu-specific endopeptidase